MTPDDLRELAWLADMQRHRLPGERVKDTCDRRSVNAALIFTRGNQAHAARVLGLSTKTLKTIAADHRMRPKDRQTA